MFNVCEKGTWSERNVLYIFVAVKFISQSHLRESLRLAHGWDPGLALI